jgi:CheY-like chemotaxis protein
VLHETLVKWGYAVVAVEDGRQAWEALQREQIPLAVLDWEMPEMDGVEVCRRARETPATQGVYLLLVTARGKTEDIVAGLQAGANDYITKPFNRAELQARIQVGIRVLDLQKSLADRVTELEDALAHVKQLQGILPICSYCKKVRNDEKYWQRVEDYVSEHSDAAFSHSICPECWETILQPEMEKLWGCKIPYEE